MVRVSGTTRLVAIGFGTETVVVRIPEGEKARAGGHTSNETRSNTNCGSIFVARKDAIEGSVQYSCHQQDPNKEWMKLGCY